jgi:hypothetical protein
MSSLHIEESYVRFEVFTAVTAFFIVTTVKTSNHIGIIIQQEIAKNGGKWPYYS